MKKITKLFSAVAFVSALALVGCADPNNNKNTNPNKNDSANSVPSLDDFTQPNGGKTNPKDKLHGKTFELIDNNKVSSKIVFGEDGTLDKYVEDGHDAILSKIGKLSYKIDDTTLITDYVSVVGQNDTFITMDEYIAESIKHAKAEPDKSMWNIVLNAANNDEKLAEQIFTVMTKTMEYPLTKYNYTYTENKLSLTPICPEITTLPNDFSNFAYFDMSAIEEAGYTIGGNYSLDYSNNKIYLIKKADLKPDTTTPTFIPGTWSKTGTGNKQVITVTIEGKEYKITPAPASTVILTEKK